MDSPETFQDYIRLTTLLNEGTRLLRLIFRSRYLQLTKIEWKNKPEFGKKLTTTLGKKAYGKCQRLQRKMLLAGNVEEWDVSLLTSLLISIDFGGDKAKVKTENQTICYLNHLRNVYAHLPDKRLSKEEFYKLWKPTAACVVKLGGDSTQIQSLLSPEDIIEISKVKIAESTPVPKVKKLSRVTQRQISTRTTGVSKMTKKLDNVAKPIRKVTRNETASSTDTPQLKLARLRERGNSALQIEDFDNAIEFYSEAMRLRRISPVEKSVVLSQRSQAHFKSIEKIPLNCNEENKKKVKSSCTLALGDARRVIELRGDWWKGHFLAAKVLQRQGKLDQALESCHEALRLNPGQKEIEGMTQSLKKMEGVKKDQKTDMKISKEDPNSVQKNENFLILRKSKNSTPKIATAPLEKKQKPLAMDFTKGVKGYTTSAGHFYCPGSMNKIKSFYHLNGPVSWWSQPKNEVLNNSKINLFSPFTLRKVNVELIPSSHSNFSSPLESKNLSCVHSTLLECRKLNKFSPNVRKLSNLVTIVVKIFSIKFVAFSRLKIS